MSSPSILRVNTLRVSAANREVLQKNDMMNSAKPLLAALNNEPFIEIEDTDPSHLRDHLRIYIASFF